MFNCVVHWLDSTHCFRLRQIPNIVHKFPEFNLAICNKIRLLEPNIDAVGGIPDDAEQCALFGDASRFEVCVCLCACACL